MRVSRSFETGITSAASLPGKRCQNRLPPNTFAITMSREALRPGLSFELECDKPLPKWLLDGAETTGGAQGARDIVVNLARADRRRDQQWYAAGAVDGFNLMPGGGRLSVHRDLQRCQPATGRFGRARNNQGEPDVAVHQGLFVAQLHGHPCGVEQFGVPCAVVTNRVVFGWS